MYVVRFVIQLQNVPYFDPDCTSIATWLCKIFFSKIGGLSYLCMLRFVMFLNQAHTRLLEITFVWEIDIMCVYICINLSLCPPPGLLKTIHVK